MAYNNPFPASYQPMNYQPPQMMQPQSQPQIQQSQMVQPQVSQNSSPMIWVQGETGAKSYLLAPNTTLPLWDSENQTIYLKSADASGMPSMKILDYTIRDNSQPQAPVINTSHEEEQKSVQDMDFVTHEEFKKFERSIRSQLRHLNKKEDKGDE